MLLHFANPTVYVFVHWVASPKHASLHLIQPERFILDSRFGVPQVN